MKDLRVRDWMTTDVITADVTMTLPEAHKLMRERGIRRLPVTRNGKLVGIVTRSDIRGAEPSEATSLSIWELNYLLAKLTLDKIMTKQVTTISPDGTLKEAASLLHERKIGALPVVDGGRLVGIMTESDIFRVLIAWFNGELAT